ncbi:aminopeptidase P family protein [Anaerosalibacter bizertensis]|uniref:Xaa-Pro aminopeptidase n=1 Tax=Anaerosalibacter bizertensis TaxID=932217 RepID=A0A9Q4FLK5_9FIRM|nr:aminopeptidase P family protein [Anaerosalibacter bizertensis]MBV1819819.1 aminopeptidase P family protein [Bacteroidales bacterium MSK.15.36]MCB5558412.1 aminopeptidase P family protein [Anaerosalibacter bizertensis]MCG4564699.1 aminopeptidase P family protein [Anaerosalibacter bizertensis]MCG4583180.1 aminopeptidase P family protein [Anaerosalibacter bizertensis]MCG4584780.1 aminopeptidase P family protein [Anaerosalibacter bizertensis]
MDKEFFIKNRKELGKALEDNSILLLFAGTAPYKSADEQYQFAPNRNFYYLTGIDREKIILLISKIDGDISEKIFVERPDPVMARWIGARMTAEEAKEVSGVENIDYLDKFEETIGSILERNRIEKLYLDLERQEIRAAITDPQYFAKMINERYPYIEIKNAYYDIAKLRVIKSDEEIQLMKKAIEITQEGIENMIDNIKPGMMEYEIEAYFDFTLKKNGIYEKAFKTIAASGKNATILHYVENNCRAEDGDLILFDLGAQYKYYNADISRTFPVNGKFTERQKQIYNVVLKAKEAVEEAARPGLPYKELNEIAKKVLTEGCKELGLIRDDKELVKYYFHSVSHYLGLDAHDIGIYNTVLKPGMVITNEPGLYIEEEGIGIRIEDDLLITEDGCENLSKDILKTVEEIEDYMNR